MDKNNYFAEVIESNLDSWIAQSWKWNKFPKFGSIIIVESSNIKLFAIVHQIQTGSIDSNRQPFIFQKTEEELLKEQPQIFEFLKTTFSCLVLGYEKKNNFFYMFPSEPPKIHAFARDATIVENENFFKNSQYLQVLFGHSQKIFNLDELLLALINNLNELNIFNKEKFDEFIEIFSLLNGNDYRRLKLFLKRIENLQI